MQLSDNSDFSRSYEAELKEIIRNVQKSQFDKFKEAARELGTDDDESRFEERLKKLVKQKPEGGNNSAEESEG